ncbi:MAG TPA: hypothetical protein VGP47_10405 [Parachlamydiaceae bacterium]|nr:hypothetical protein [Parachlamydiaceae bacterium]
MNASDHHELLIEVKCSRRSSIKITERDIRGLQSDRTTSHGFLATLVTANQCEGPHWVLVNSQHLSCRNYKANQLMSLKADVEFWKPIDYLWGEAIQDEVLMDRLLSLKKIDLRSVEWWHRLPFEPGSGPHNAIRKLKLTDALERLRSRLDEKHRGYGSRREGFLHQIILHLCLEKAGYRTLSNFIGVPDIRTQKIQRSSLGLECV